MTLNDLQMKKTKLTKLNSEVDIRNAGLNIMFIVRVSFPNTELQPLYLASYDQIKREEVSEYLRSNGYDVDEYKLICWIPKKM